MIHMIHMYSHAVCNSLRFSSVFSFCVFGKSVFIRSQNCTTGYHCTCCMVSHREHSVAKVTCVRDAQPCLQSRPDGQHGQTPSKCKTYKNVPVSRSFRLSSSFLKDKIVCVSCIEIWADELHLIPENGFLTS